jgi:transposase
MIAKMTPAEIKSLIAEAKDAFGSANADKLGGLVERLAAALERAAAVIEMQAAIIEAHKTALSERDAKIDALERRLAEQAADIAELKIKAGERTSEIAYLKAQVFGPKSEKSRYAGDAAEAATAPAGIDDEASVSDETAPPAAGGSGADEAAEAKTVAAGVVVSETNDQMPTAAAAAGEPKDAETEGSAAAQAGADEAAKKDKRKRARKLERDRKPPESKRTVYSPELAHEIVQHKLPPDLNLPCPLCGDPVKSRGKSVEATEIDTGESAVTIRTHHQDKATCGCGALSFVMPGPVRAVPNTNFSPAFAARVIVDKFFAHLPLNRQAALFAQQGLRISRDRLIMLVLGCWLEVEAVVARIRELNRAQSHQGCDESPIRVVVDGEKEQRFIWCLTSKQAITYEITPKRNKKTARDVIGGGIGVLTTDRLAIYRMLFEGKDNSGCLSHLRRYFWYALDTAPDEAMPVIELIGELYEVEAEAKNQKLGPEERKALREKKSAPILARLEAQLKATSPPERTPLAKAVNYATKHWQALTFFMTDGAVEIDNNECERRLRLPKLGWANWKQPQSELGIEAVAGFYTIISTCALHGINPRRYLADLLTKLAKGWPASRLDELLPWNWVDPAAVYGPPAPKRRTNFPAVAEIIELARVRARIKAVKRRAEEEAAANG